MRKEKGQFMEMQSQMGVVTRSKTLALKRHQATAAEAEEDDGGSYLVLRNRRLKKISPLVEVRKKRNPKGGNVKNKKKNEENDENENDVVNVDGAANGERVEEDAFVGERATRESTPIDLIINSNNIRTPPPVPSTKRSRAREGSSRVLDAIKSYIPESQLLKDCLIRVEDEQRKEFIDKYNFDPANDKPMPGRFKWVKIDP